MKKSEIVSVRFLPEELEWLCKACPDGNMSAFIRERALKDAGFRHLRSTLCEWKGSYHTIATGFVRDRGRDHPLCDEHLNPALHPPDLQKALHPNERPKNLCFHG